MLLSALLLGYPAPLAPVQILWINLVTDGIVAMPLIAQPAGPDALRVAPVPLGQRLLHRRLLGRAALMATAMLVSTLGWFVVRSAQGAPFDLVRTEAFTVLAACQWFNALNCRSPHRSALAFRGASDGWLALAIALGVTLHAAVLYLPWGGLLFRTVPVPLETLLGIVAVASLVLWAEELRKVVVRLAARRRRPRHEQPSAHTTTESEGLPAR